jgi:CheY-like chemotaxis protein
VPALRGTNTVETTDESQLARRVAVLVDDDQPFGDMISDLLVDEFGCSVLVCPNADQAEPMVLAVHADVVLLDLILPGGGRAALRALKLNPATRLVPVIVCTVATLVDRERDELLALGAAAILAKPFDLVDLLKLLGQFIPVRPGGPPWRA